MSNCAKFGRFPAISSWDQFFRRNEERSLRNGQISVQLCIENDATKQLSWTFLPISARNFFTQFSPVDPFENELYEETKRSFSSKNAILAPQSCLKTNTLFLWLSPIGSYFFNTTLWGELFKRGELFFNVIFSPLAERNSFLTVARPSFSGQRTRPMVYMMDPTGVIRGRELFFRCWYRERELIERGFIQGGAIQENTVCRLGHSKRSFEFCWNR